MDRREFLSQSIRCSIASGATCILSGCGTILHGDRVGQPHSRDIDWKVAALNGLGLAFFFVPGVVAFAVDFYTGAIYLPNPGEDFYDGTATPSQHAAFNERLSNQPESGSSTEPARMTSFKKIDIPPRQFEQGAIEKAVANIAGKKVDLSSDARVSQLDQLDEFPIAQNKHRRNPLFGIPGRQFFWGRTA